MERFPNWLAWMSVEVSYSLAVVWVGESIPKLMFFSLIPFAKMVKLWFIKPRSHLIQTTLNCWWAECRDFLLLTNPTESHFWEGSCFFLPLMHSRLRFLDLNFLMSTLSKRLDWQMQNLTAERQWHICSLRIWCKFCFCCLVVPKANKLLGTQVDALHSICWKEFIYSEHFLRNFLTCQGGLFLTIETILETLKLIVIYFFSLSSSVLISTYLDQPIHPSSYMLECLLLSTSVMSPPKLA